MKAVGSVGSYMNKALRVLQERIERETEKYPWPDENIPAEEVSKNLGKHGQAARVARYLRDIAHQKGDNTVAQEFGQKAETYAAYVPDQKAKL